MISLAEHQRLVAAAVQSALAQMQQQFAAEIAQVQAQTATLQRQMAERIVPLQDALAQAKRTIAALQTKLYGVRAETCQVVLTAEGQQFIDAAWGLSRDATPAPPPLVEVPATTVRRPRDHRGLAQRFPHLPLQEQDAALPPELAEQVAAGALIARRSGTHHDELVLPASKPFLRRVHELELLKPGGSTALMQIMPDRIVPGGDLADETIHRLVEAKFLDAMPFHRQLAQIGRAGVEIRKQTVNDAVNAWGGLFAPLSLAILPQVLASDVVHADASWQRLQASGSCDRLHLWTLLGGGQAAYRMTPDLRHERASELIPAGFAHRLVTDAWPGWLKLPLGERLGLCNAHARRPFADWLKRTTQDPHALRIVALYREIARCEHEAAIGPPAELLDQRRRIRAERSHPIMAQILDAARATLAAYGGKHKLGDGAAYIIDHWQGLSRFLDDPLLPTDNNAAENALRINALIRKNSMFSGSEDAADRDAIALTILQSCKLSGLNPADCLANVTPTLLLHRRGRKQNLAAITPASMAAVRQATASS